MTSNENNKEASEVFTITDGYPRHEPKQQKQQRRTGKCALLLIQTLLNICPLQFQQPF